MGEMIFITLGSQKFQFNRLLQAVDELIEKKVIVDEVFAQSGYSDYKPRYYKYKPFIDREEFVEYEARANILITHGGTGAIIGAIKKGKKVIAVARRAQYGEHVDDHQLQIIKQFQEQNLISGIIDISELESAVKDICTHTFEHYVSNTDKIIKSIEDFIKDEVYD